MASTGSSRRGKTAKRTVFDKPYYDRFYGRSRRRIASQREEAAHCDFVCAYLKYLRQPVRNVADVGCGFGPWRELIARHFPKARYTGVEVSDYLCEKFGWVHASAIDFAARVPFDLVVCNDALQYLPDAAASAAIDNLASLTRGVLYFNLLTLEDWQANCDRDRTDSAVYIRPADWYRKRLRDHFTNLGGGLFLSPRAPAIPWELETLRT
jgi:SAM-dependent methyltransferase